jgi:hypothetical protein
MKPMKMFGLALVAVIAAMAFIGAGSASAVTACKVNKNPCPTGEEYKSGTIVKAKLLGTEEAVLHATGTPNVLCKVSESEGVSTATSGTPLSGEIKNLTFKECRTATLVSCEVTTVNLPYKAAIESNPLIEGDGFLTATSSGKGNPGAKVVCLGVINCTFTAAAAELRIEGGAPAMLIAEEVPLSHVGAECPSAATWSAAYEVTAPNPAWIESGP